MRCTCCNRNLSDFESTRKNRTTGEYLDMCNQCYSSVQEDLDTTIRPDLNSEEIPDEEVGFDEDGYMIDDDIETGEEWDE
jgi:hypothetical protein